METLDRPEFERQVSLICAAYNVPMGDRGAAYWTAFNRLGIIEFARIVERVIGPDGPDKMPTVKQLWDIRRELKHPKPAPRSPNSKDVLTALVETALAKWPLTDAQRRLAWNWITRFYPAPGRDGKMDPTFGAEILGVIIPQDPDDPEHYPAHRLMRSDVERPHG